MVAPERLHRTLEAHAHLCLVDLDALRGEHAHVDAGLGVVKADAQEALPVVLDLDDIAVGVSVSGDVFLHVAALGAGYIAIYLLVGYLFFAWREL